MRIVTYNIYKGGEDRLPIIKDVLVSLKPDIVGLQEANGFDVENNHTLRELGDVLGLEHSALAKGTGTEKGNQYHVAVLSRYAFKNVVCLDQKLHHAALHAIMDTPFGELALSVAHLHPSCEEARFLEAKMITDLQNEYRQRIIMGDLNALCPFDQYPDDLADKLTPGLKATFAPEGKLLFHTLIEFMSAGYFDAARLAEASHTTFPTPLSRHAVDGFSFRIDYVLVSPKLARCVKEVSVSAGGLVDRASDHKPLLVVLSDD